MSHSNIVFELSLLSQSGVHCSERCTAASTSRIDSIASNLDSQNANSSRHFTLSRIWSSPFGGVFCEPVANPGKLCRKPQLS